MNWQVFPRKPGLRATLLVSQIIDSGLARAGRVLRIVKRTRVQAIQVVLTLVAWSALGFRRLFHVDDFEGWADMGLPLFTGALRLWSDTTLWRWVHEATPESVLACHATGMFVPARWLSDRVSRDTGTVGEIVDATLVEICEALKRGECVCLRNFGTFYVRPERSSWVFNFNPSQRLRKLFGWSSSYKGEP
jgi:DNA-binding protein HU-beta